MNIKLTVALTAGLLYSSSSLATINWEITNVLRILQPEDNSLGGCMIEIADLPAGLNCPTTESDPTGRPSAWIVLDCEGKYGPKSNGSRKFDMAMAALLLNQTVQVFVDDEKGDDGYCLGSQFRLVAPSS